MTINEDNYAREKKYSSAAPHNNRNIVPSRHLWVGRCLSTSKNHLNKIFHHFGEIESISYDKREHFAFIDYVDASSAMRAYVAMQDQVVGARRVKLAFGKQDSDQEDESGWLGGE